MLLNTNRFSRVLIIVLVCLGFLAVPPPTPARAAALARVTAADSELRAPDGGRFFVYGVNYQGPADQAWQMWRDDRFDRDRIAEDFRRMQAGGFNAVRIFVQAPLAADLADGRFDKLDFVLAQADAHGLRVIMTLADDGENRVETLTERARQLAKRYAGRGAILAWDLRNEPQIGTFATATYPAGQVVPMFDAKLIERYGERLSRAQTPAWRAGPDGRSVTPQRFSNEQAYVWGNVLEYYRDFLREAAVWVNKAPGRSSADFAASNDGAKWRPLMAAISDTMLIWLAPQVDAIREADPGALVTIGYNNSVLAVQPANSRLQLHAYHRFPSLGASQWRLTFASLDSIARTFPGRPLLLEEFGYSNRTRDGHAVSEGQTAAHETAVWLELAHRNLAGGLKWMLYDFDAGANPYENAFGVLRGNGAPKPSYLIGQALAPALPWSVTSLDLTGSGSNLDFVARGPGLLVMTGPQQAPEASVTTGDNGIMIAHRLGDSSRMTITVTQTARIRLDTHALLGIAPDQAQVTTISGDDLPSTVDGGRLALGVQPGAPVIVAGSRPTARVEPLTGPAGQIMYFPETGHNLIYGFKTYWERNGGLAIYGYPITEEFREINPADGKEYTVQYFQRARFEYHPEHKGTAYETELGLLGRQVTVGREGEASFRRVASGGDTSERRSFATTGHTLTGGFLYYWDHHGGLAQFGYPISEEFQERNPADGKTYTVQYFERARFEYHPEHKGTPYETELGLLGWQIVFGETP